MEVPRSRGPAAESDPPPEAPEGAHSGFSRRWFLGTPGATGAAAAMALAAGAGILTWADEQKAQAAAPPSAPAAHQWVMVFDLRKCDGCVTQDKAPQCVEGCNREHFVPAGQSWMRVFQMEGAGGHAYFMPRPCMQCENAPCLNVCPVGATYRNTEGVILVDNRKCIGCRMCMAACPYGARSFNWNEPENPPQATLASYSPEYPIPHRKGTVAKCMLCAHRTKDGELPACSESCPMNAIYLGDLVQDVATNGKEVVKLSRFLAENGAFRFKEELGTRPRVWYIRGHGEEFGRTIDDGRQAKQPRSWQEQAQAQKKTEAPSASHTAHVG